MSENSVEQDTSEIGVEHYYASKGKGRGKGCGKGKGRGRGSSHSSAPGTTCQICAKPNHDATICWYRYDFNPNIPSQGHGFNAGPPRPQTNNSYMNPSAHLAIPAYMPRPIDNYLFDTQSEATWYPDSGASHHLTYNLQNLMMCNPYNGNERVMMDNGQGLLISPLGQSSFYSNTSPNIKLTLKDLLHVPTISKNLLSVRKFAQDNNVIFEFHPYKCFVKSQASRQILLEGRVGVDGLYKFQPFQFLKTPGEVSPSASNKASSVQHSVVSNNGNNSLSSVQCNNALSIACNSEFHTWHLRQLKVLWQILNG
jgi:histone deacetylase 1/2